MKYLKNIIGFIFVILFIFIFVLVISLKDLNTISRLLLLFIMLVGLLIINIFIRPLMDKISKK